MVAYKIGSKLSCIGMIGTVAHETASQFAPIHEFFSAHWNRYDGGPVFHGRGFIQLTHRYNYQKVGNELGLDLVNFPDQALDPVIAAKAACIYWRDRDIASMCERQDWAAVRRAVYGGNDPVGQARIQRVYDLLSQQ